MSTPPRRRARLSATPPGTGWPVQRSAPARQASAWPCAAPWPRSETAERQRKPTSRPTRQPNRPEHAAGRHQPWRSSPAGDDRHARPTVTTSNRQPAEAAPRDGWLPGRPEHLRPRWANRHPIRLVRQRLDPRNASRQESCGGTVYFVRRDHRGYEAEPATRTAFFSLPLVFGRFALHRIGQEAAKALHAPAAVALRAAVGRSHAKGQKGIENCTQRPTPSVATAAAVQASSPALHPVLGGGLGHPAWSPGHQ